jgi:hypothetical protein
MIIFQKTQAKGKRKPDPRSRVDEFHLLLNISWGAQDGMSLWENVVHNNKISFGFLLHKGEIFSPI